MPDKTLREILDELEDDLFTGDECMKDDLDKAETAIKSLLKEKLPKAKLYHEEKIEMTEIENELLRSWDDGFNTCLSLITKIIEEA